jgi:hypothetical protein
MQGRGLRPRHLADCGGHRFFGDVERAVEIAAEMAGVPAKPVLAILPRPLFGRLIDGFASRVARSIVDEIEIRLSDHLRM